MNEMHEHEQKNGNITIFNSELAADWDTDKQLKYFGLLALYLSIAADNAGEGLIKSGWEIAKIADNELGGYLLESDLYETLTHAVKVYMAYEDDMFNNRNEFYYQALFNQYANKIIKGCKVIKEKGDEHNQPDSWVEINGIKAPVEVKLNNFNNNALKQLQRYMKAFKTELGVAVGRDLTTELPDNIIFVSNNQLDVLDSERKIRKRKDNELSAVIRTLKEKYINNVDNSRRPR